MTPVSLTQPRVSLQVPPELIHSAGLVRDAAEILAQETGDVSQCARFRHLADRLASALGSPRLGRLRLLMISPALTDRLERNRTLIEIIAEEPGDDEHQLRLAKLLLRVLDWRPETLPIPPV